MKTIYRITKTENKGANFLILAVISFLVFTISTFLIELLTNPFLLQRSF